MQKPERSQKSCGHSEIEEKGAVFSGFGVVSPQSQGRLGPAPSPDSPQNSKIVAPNRHRFFSSALIGLLGVALLGSGCAAITALSSSSSGTSMLDSFNPSSSALEIHNQTQVKLTEGNFVTVKTNVVGQARGFSLLGFISLVPARFQTAMDRLYGRAQMQTGKPQVLGNLVMEKTSSYWILFSIPRVSVRADVVEFIPGGAAIIIPHTAPPDDSTPPQEDKSNGGAGKQL